MDVQNCPWGRGGAKFVVINGVGYLRKEGEKKRFEQMEQKPPIVNWLLGGASGAFTRTADLEPKNTRIVGRTNLR